MNLIVKIIHQYKIKEADKFFLRSLIVVAGLYIIAILRPDRAYIDDLGRSLWGYGHWSEVGRPLADLVMLFLNIGLPLTDLSPWPQILAIAVLCASCFVVHREIQSSRMPPLLSASISFFILLNPFLIENMSYKFDSLPMALSMFFAAIAGASSIGGKVGVILRVFFLMFSLLLYQAAVNLFLVLSLLYFLRDAMEEAQIPDLRERLLNPFLSFIISISIYALISRAFIPVTGYPSVRAKTLEITWDVWTPILENYFSYFHFIYSSFEQKDFSVILFIFFLATVSCVVNAIQKWRRQQIAARNWHFKTIVGTISISVFMSFFVAIGAFVIFEEPPVLPRVLMSFGGVLALSCYAAASIFLTARDRIRSPTGRLAAFVGAHLPALFLFLLSVNHVFAFSVAQAAQKEFDREIISRVEKVLDANGIRSGPVLIEGHMPMAPRAKIISRRYPLITDLVPRYMSGDWIWGYTMLRYYGLDLYRANESERERVISNAKSDMILGNDRYFNLYKNGDVLVLRF